MYIYIQQIQVQEQGKPLKPGTYTKNLITKYLFF
jgi:hypothetical protein